MKLVILPSASDDLADGFAFYEEQGEGLGSYFLEALSSDIDSLRLFAGIHRKQGPPDGGLMMEETPAKSQNR